VTTRVIREESSDTTRERILKAAMLRFSTHSYEETGLRAIASDAGVDMAYVHRSFGSKEKLFYASVKASIQPELNFDRSADDLLAGLAKDVLINRRENEVRPLDIIIRSFSSPEASCVIKEILSNDFVAPLVCSYEGASPRSATLVAALLLGVGVLRDVVHADALADDGATILEHELVRLIASILDNGVRQNE